MATLRPWRKATSLFLCLSASACAAPWTAMPESSVPTLGGASSDPAPPGARSEAERGIDGSGAPAPVSSSSTGSPRPAHRWARTVGWISVAVGAESAVVAGVTSFMLLHQKAVRDRECDAARRCSSVGVDANGTIDSLVGWNTATWVVAMAGVGAGLALVLTHPAPPSPTATLTIAPTPGGGAALGLTRAF